VVRLGLGLSADKTIYFAEGTYPEVWLCKPGEEHHETWHLKPPAGYIPPPQKALDPKYRVDMVKVTDFYESFTYIVNVSIIHDYFLLVSWKVNNHPIYSLDMYDIRGRQPVFLGQEVPGQLTDVKDSQIFILEHLEPEELYKAEKYILHSFKTRLTQ